MMDSPQNAVSTRDGHYLAPTPGYVPPEVYSAADNHLGRKVALSFDSELDPDVLRFKAVKHVQAAIGLLPEQLKMTASEVPIPEDFGWLVALLIQSFPAQKLLSFSTQDLVGLIQQLIRRLDLNEVSSEMVHGPAMMAIAGSVLSSPRMVLSPLERTLMSSVVRSLSYLAPVAASLFQQDARIPSGEIPYGWRVALARSVRLLRSRKVTVDRSWAQARGRLMLGEASPRGPGPIVSAEGPNGLGVEKHA